MLIYRLALLITSYIFVNDRNRKSFSNSTITVEAKMFVITYTMMVLAGTMYAGILARCVIAEVGIVSIITSTIEAVIDAVSTFLIMLITV
jgi:hypothetical protein